MFLRAVNTIVCVAYDYERVRCVLTSFRVYGRIVLSEDALMDVVTKLHARSRVSSVYAGVLWFRWGSF